MSSKAGFFEKAISSAQSAAASLRVKSALNPMLWLCGIISLPCLLLAYLIGTASPLAVIFSCIGAAPILSTIIGFFYFMIFKADKLQSEEYQLRHEAIEFIKQKGSSIEIEPS